MTATEVRRPAVAGRFYPSEPVILRRDVAAYLSQESPRKSVRALGCIAPHAGYIYSGQVAGSVFARLEVPQLCILLCPNHTGLGRPLALVSQGSWETPLSSVPIDRDFAVALQRRFPLLEEDPTAHRQEHAIEVELPFLQIRQPELTFVPIALGTRNFEVLAQLGSALADVAAAQPQPILIVASSDMNHYESDEITRVKDESAMQAILALDARALFDVVTLQSVSMCGFGPAISMLTAARQLGATSAEVVRYATSGDVSGERKRVVGYAGIIVS
jgi:AmmeMemoRadiSam system protein B